MNLRPKYKFAFNEKKVDGVVLKQIEATRSFGRIKRGQLGGYIEHVDNLDEYGGAWIDENSIVMGHSHVTGNARLVNSTVKSNCHISGDCEIIHSQVNDNARIDGRAYVKKSIVKDNARIGGNVRVNDGCIIGGRSIVEDYALVYDHVVTDGDFWIRHQSKITGPVIVSGNLTLDGTVSVQNLSPASTLSLCGNFTLSVNTVYHFSMTRAPLVVSVLYNDHPIHLIYDEMNQVVWFSSTRYSKQKVSELLDNPSGVNQGLYRLISQVFALSTVR